MLYNFKIRLGWFVNHTIVQGIMIFFTLYALTGDDIRLLVFDKSYDNQFTNLNILTMSLFFAELLMSSIGIKDYFLSIFFWLDLISTISLITDIEPLWNEIISSNEI